MRFDGRCFLRHNATFIDDIMNMEGISGDAIVAQLCCDVMVLGLGLVPYISKIGRIKC